ncbi:MAG: HAMP domain-containing histidine kinase [Clostridia bacterium]|nr:HAMP domain-containing histidine kinase [Clostridia bacterium]
MRRNQIRFIVILGTFAIIGIFIIQIYWLQKAWNISEKEFTQTVYIALRNVAVKLSDYNQTELPDENPVSRLSSNYFVVNTNSVIDANILDYYLRTEFDKLNITTDYEYGIYDCHTDQMVYGNYITAGGEHDKQIKLTTTLPKYSEYVYYFGVNFPTKTNYLSGDMSLWFIFSGILLVSVIFYAWAIFIILRQKRLSELQKDFINNMTHEFKTPISSINISADVILSPDILQQPERLRNYGAIIKQENTRLNHQVEKVLQIARIERNGFGLKPEPLQLNDIIDLVVNNCKTGNGARISIEKRLDADISEIKADKLHLTNIIHNLLDNAIKYSTDTPYITISTQKTHHHIIFSISDKGPGIPKEYQKKVFQKFYRIPTGNVHDVKGFGLGLYYVKNICEAHRWDISLESLPGHGAVFTIQIPASSWINK